MGRYWTWPNIKDYLGVYEEGQQFGFTKYDRTGKGQFFHNGFDLGSAKYPDQKILAMHSGTVIYANWAPAGYELLGTTIVIKTDDNYYNIYQEFGLSTSDIKVSVGQKIKLGELIGLRRTSHLHVGITKKHWLEAQSSAYRDDGTWLDPVKVIREDKTTEIVNTRTRQNVVTFWHVANGTSANNVINYCKSKKLNYKTITGKDGRWMISIGTWSQNSDSKFDLEQYLADNKWNFMVELADSGVAVQESDSKIANVSNPHVVESYWYTKNTESYNFVIKYLKEENLKYTEEIGGNGSIKLKVTPFAQHSQKKFELEKFLGSNNKNYSVSLRDKK